MCTLQFLASEGYEAHSDDVKNAFGQSLPLQRPKKLLALPPGEAFQGYTRSSWWRSTRKGTG